MSATVLVRCMGCGGVHSSAYIRCMGCGTTTRVSLACREPPQRPSHVERLPWWAPALALWAAVGTVVWWLF